ncbi:MAG: hypothetical protein ACRYG2_07050 [Janthinobacterium lividum]
MVTREAQIIARACGKAHLLHLEPEDLVAVTVEAAATARRPPPRRDGRRHGATAAGRDVLDAWTAMMRA